MGFCNLVTGSIIVPYKENFSATLKYAENILSSLPYYGEDDFPFLSREFFHFNIIEESKVTDFRSKLGGGYKWFTISCAYTLKEVAEYLPDLILKWEELLHKFEYLVESNLSIDMTPYDSTYHFNWKIEGDTISRQGPKLDNFK